MRSNLHSLNLFVVLFIVISMLCGGLIFHEYFFAVAAVVFAWICIMQNGINVNKYIFSVLCLAAIYAIGMCFIGINTEKAIIGAFEILLYFAVFIIFSAYKNSDALIKTIMRTLVWSSIVCFIVNISALMYGVLPKTDGVMAFSLVIPYSNTLGLIFAVSAFWCLYEGGKLFYSLHFICLAGLIMTYSYASVAVYFFCVFIYLILRRRYKYFICLAIFVSLLLIIVLPKISLSSFMERLIYYKDSVRIFFDYPFGVGKGGWSSIYPKYQTEIYAVENVHSSLFQTILDFGVVGILLYIVAITFFVCLHRRAKNKKAAIAVMLVFIMIWLHSLVDSDFQFPIIVILIIACEVYMIKEASLSEFKINALWMKPVSLFLSVICIIFSISYFYYNLGYKNLESENINRANSYLGLSVKLNPFSSSGYYLLYHTTNELCHIEKAIELDSYNPRNFAAKAKYENNKEDTLTELIERQPYNIRAYEELFFIYKSENQHIKIQNLKKDFDKRKALLSPKREKNLIFELSEEVKELIEY